MRPMKNTKNNVILIRLRRKKISNPPKSPQPPFNKGGQGGIERGTKGDFFAPLRMTRAVRATFAELSK